MSGEIDITLEQLMEEISRLDKEYPEGFTVSEMVDTTGHSPAWCRKRINKLMLHGKVFCAGRKPTQAIDGTVRYAPVYAFVEEREDAK